MYPSLGPGGQSLPKHVGDNVLPNFPLFNRLLFFASNRDKLVINDTTNGLQATHRQLLSDVLYLRNALWAQLDSKVRDRLLAGDEICVNLLAAGGYEFSTGFLALLALGAVVVPICEQRDFLCHITGQVLIPEQRLQSRYMRPCTLPKPPNLLEYYILRNVQ